MGRCDASLLVIKDASKFSNDVCPIILAYIVACVLANVWDYVLEKGLSNFLCHDHFKRKRILCPLLCLQCLLLDPRSSPSVLCMCIIYSIGFQGWIRMLISRVED